jgi:hypothetical protein
LIDYIKKHEAKKYWKSIEPLRESTVINAENSTIQTHYSLSNEISLFVTADECLDLM